MPVIDFQKKHLPLGVLGAMEGRAAFVALPFSSWVGVHDFLFRHTAVNNFYQPYAFVKRVLHLLSVGSHTRVTSNKHVIN
jgi:hypothetical protein